MITKKHVLSDDLRQFVNIDWYRVKPVFCRKPKIQNPIRIHKTFT